MQRVVEISDLPVDRRIFIFGAACGGALLLAALTRHHIPVAGFIDDVAVCAPKELPLLSSADFLAVAPADAAILIASQHWAKIALLFAGTDIALFNAMPLISRQDIGQSVAIDQGHYFNAIMWRMRQRLSFLLHSDFPEACAFGAIGFDQAQGQLRDAAAKALASYQEAARFGPLGTEILSSMCDCLEFLDRHQEVLTFVEGILAESSAAPGQPYANLRFIADMRQRQLSAQLALGDHQGLTRILAAPPYGLPPTDWAVSPEKDMDAWTAAWNRSPTLHVAQHVRPARLQVRDGGRWHDLDATFTDPPLASVSLQDVTILDGLLPLTRQGDHLTDRDEWQARIRSMPSILAEQPDRLVYRIAKTPEVVEEPCLFFGGHFGYRDNYAHFLVQQVARFAWLGEQAAMSGRKLAMAGEPTRTQDEVLTAMGFGPHRRIILSATASTVLRDVIIPSPPTRDRFPSGTELQVLRRRALAHYGISDHAEGTRRLYLSRRSQYRNPGNWLALEQHAAELGFDVIDLGAPPFGEQVRLFSQAKVICGPMGAAFTNMAFAPPDTVVALLQPRENIIAWFPAMAASLGHRMLMCLGNVRLESVGGHWNVLGYDIDEEDAVQTMRAALAAADGP